MERNRVRGNPRLQGQPYHRLLDGKRLHQGKAFSYKHNDIVSCEQKLKVATKVAEEQGGGVLLITEGVYGMTGALGILDQIAALKKKYKAEEVRYGHAACGGDSVGLNVHV